jgi:hypothetical protein
MLQRIVCGGATPAASRAMTTASIRARRVIWESTPTPARRLALAVAAGYHRRHRSIHAYPPNHNRAVSGN